MALMIRTRFAPSPNGPLHLGHAFAAIVAHDLARERGGAFVLRIEDIDGTRSRPEFVAGIIADLAWLGLAWDGEPVFQSRRLASYAQAGERLKAMGLLYPCTCTRALVRSQAISPSGRKMRYSTSAASLSIRRCTNVASASRSGG